MRSKLAHGSDKNRATKRRSAPIGGPPCRHLTPWTTIMFVLRPPARPATVMRRAPAGSAALDPHRHATRLPSARDLGQRRVTGPHPELGRGDPGLREQRRRPPTLPRQHQRHDRARLPRPARSDRRGAGSPSGPSGDRRARPARHRRCECRGRRHRSPPARRHVPSLNSASVRVRTRCVLPPCRAPAAHRRRDWSTSSSTAICVFTKRIVRPLRAAIDAAMANLSFGGTSNMWWSMDSTDAVAGSIECVTGSIRSA